ncbi:unnamed protein product [Gadus morhua 'NCC']
MPTAGGAKAELQPSQATVDLSPPGARSSEQPYHNPSIHSGRWFDLIRSRPARLLSTTPSLDPAIPAVQWPCRLKRAGPLTSDPHQEKVASA